MAGSIFITIYKQSTVKQIGRRLTPQEKQYALSRIRDFMEERPTETHHNSTYLVITEYAPIYSTFPSHSLNTSKLIKTDQTEHKKHKRNHSDEKGITKSFDYSYSRHLRRSSDIGCWNFSDHQHINKIKQLHINKNLNQLTVKYGRSNENTDYKHTLQPEAPVRNSRKGTRAYKNSINCN